MKQIENIQTKAYIAEQIRNAILSGEIEAGEELAQASLADMLGVSRMPVREALQSLEQEGFLKRLPNRHMQVVALNKEQIESTFRIIAAMETEMAIQIYEKKKAGYLENFLQEIQKTQKAKNPEAEIQLEMRFHELLADLTENQYMRQIQQTLMNGYVAYAVKSEKDRPESFSLLAQIVEAVKEQNEAAVRTGFFKYYKRCSKSFG